MHCVNFILISVPLIYFACYTFVKLYYIYVGRKTNKLELELDRCAQLGLWSSRDVLKMQHVLLLAPFFM